MANQKVILEGTGDNCVPRNGPSIARPARLVHLILARDESLLFRYPLSHQVYSTAPSRVAGGNVAPYPNPL